MATKLPSVIFENFIGINNIKDKYALEVTELQVANNVDISNSGGIYKRQGYTKLLDGSFHSLFATDFILLAVRGTDLVYIDSNLNNITVLRSNVSNLEMSYTLINDIIIYSNGKVLGYIQNYKDYPMYLEDIPIPTLTTYYNGRLYLSFENTLYVSNPYKYFEINADGFLQFDDVISFLKSVDGGIYLSGSDLKFLGGDTFENLSVRTILPYKVLSGNLIDATYLNLDFSVTGKVLYMLTENGFVVGLPNGNLVSITNNSYMPNTKLTGNGIHKIDGNISQYITLIKE